MNYLELKCEFNPLTVGLPDILTAYLAELGFESFVETETGLLAYIRQDYYTEEIEKRIDEINIPETSIKYSKKIIEEQNWNETWEKNYFQPIIVDNKVLIRSTFHKNTPKLKYEIIIDPKMAFGTGHHETTYLMMSEILKMDVQGKTVLDMGCGTSVLAILCSYKGAKEILAVDIDEWSVNNSRENISLNSVKNIHIQLGDKSELLNKNFNIILANINKNVLKQDIPDYAPRIYKGGKLLLSGFYQEDFEEINEIAIKNRLLLQNKQTKNNWLVLRYLKI